MANYKISIEATKDLENIWAYTLEKWSVEQDDRYIYQIFNEIEYLAIKPQLGKDFSFVRKGYLRRKVNFHYIFYKISKRYQLIEVVRILHEKMDVQNRL